MNAAAHPLAGRMRSLAGGSFATPGRRRTLAAAAASTGQPTRRRVTGTPKPPVIAVVRLVGRTLARSVWALDITGREHVPTTGPVLLAGNHSGILDGPLVFVATPRPAALLTKSEVFVGVWARACGWLRMIPVQRGSADRAALQSALQELSSGGVVGVFPEGTRGTGTFDQITDGLAYLALRSSAPVVPVAVHGSSAALPKGRVLPRLRTPVRIAFGAPVRLEVVGDPRARSTVRAAAESLRAALVDHLAGTTPAVTGSKGRT